MSKIKHILFDCDGVLVDTEFIAAHKMTAMMASLGAPLDVDYYLNNLSGSTFSAIMTTYFGDKFNAEEALAIIDRVEDQVAQEVKLIDGMNTVLGEISLPKSVVSNSSIKTVQHALDKAGIASYFENRIYSSEQVAQPKPASDLYLFAINSLGLHPDEIIVVEDSITGATAAMGAKLRVVGFTGGSHILPDHNKRLSSLGVESIAGNANQLLQIISNILNA
jgi:HAD superfamily hydrolase (TIGR01509 family)